MTWWEQRRGQVESMSFSRVAVPSKVPRDRKSTRFFGFGLRAKRRVPASSRRIGRRFSATAHRGSGTCGRDVPGRYLGTGRVPCAGKDARRVRGSLRFMRFGISTAWVSVKRGKPVAVVAEIQAMGTDSAARDIVSNRRSLDYPRSRREGLRHSSSRVESACRNVFGARLKQSRICWTVDSYFKRLEERAPND